MFSEIYFLNVMSIGAKDKQAMSMKETHHVQDLNKIMLSWDQAGFVKQDTIHSKQAIRFSKEVLNIDEKVEKTLVRGLEIETTRPVPDYFEVNNMSARKNMGILRDKFKDWESKGKVTEVKNPPRIINPLSLVSKYDGEVDKMKHRPVIDQSRCVNLLVEDKKLSWRTCRTSSQCTSRAPMGCPGIFPRCIIRCA